MTTSYIGIRLRFYTGNDLVPGGVSVFFARKVRRRLITLAVSVTSVTAAAHAQTSYRNLDAGFPVRVEDATATERYSLDLDFLNFRYDELSDLRTRFQYEPQLSYGILPRTEAWLRLPIFYRERNAAPRGGVAGGAGSPAGRGVRLRGGRGGVGVGGRSPFLGRIPPRRGRAPLQRPFPSRGRPRPFSLPPVPTGGPAYFPPRKTPPESPPASR